MSLFYTTTSLDEAWGRLYGHGGYLLDLGDETETLLDRQGAAVGERHTGYRVYAVCDEAEAIDLGRTAEELAALAPAYSEVPLVTALCHLRETAGMNQRRFARLVTGDGRSNSTVGEWEGGAIDPDRPTVALYVLASLLGDEQLEEAQRILDVLCPSDDGVPGSDSVAKA